MFLWRAFRLLVLGVLAFNLFLFVSHRCAHHPQSEYAAAQSADRSDSPLYFSPDTNLEEVEIGMIDHAQHSIDVAMFAFTDRRIAAALRHAAERGVKVRIYRDRGQYEDEGTTWGQCASDHRGRAKHLDQGEKQQRINAREGGTLRRSSPARRFLQLVNLRGAVSGQRNFRQ
jgi:phosphatidylserine/phosphatidylglycerophosphate/cardiolipin synthase-like enzyme